MTIKCPKCGKQTSVELKDSISEDGEIFRCTYCHWPFMYSSI